LSSLRRKILVADSDEIVLALISHILTRQGFLVETALTADEAAERLRAERFEAVLLDVKFSKVMASWPDAPTRGILLGAAPGAALRVRATLEKPLEFGALLDAVVACVEQ
jgi:DNA-binding NarL/FixJ family response regulator